MPTRGGLPTGMGNVTAKRYNKMKDDMQRFAQSNYDNKGHHRSSHRQTKPAASPFTLLGNAVRNIFAN